MTGPVVDRTVVRAYRRADARSFRVATLVFLCLGLLVGALACAADLAAGGHGAHRADTVVAMAPEHGDHDGHSAAGGRPGAAEEPTSIPGVDVDSAGHPGMACLVSADLRFPEPAIAASSDEFDASPRSLHPACSADIDPPVPRPS